jgi:RecA/RadA recombinase
LSTYIGFLLFRREVIAFFSIEGENKVIMAQVYSLIGQQAKSLMSKPDNVAQILKIKSMLDVFHKVLEIVDLDSKSSQYTAVLA